MKLSLRSYPHPVVGNRDDVPGAAFQATVEMSADKESVFLDVLIACSSATICRLVEEKAVAFVLHVECSNTLFRRAFEFSETKKRFSIDNEDLSETVEVNVFARALRDLPGYSIDGAHADYGDARFEIRAGDILAVSEGYVFMIESKFDSLARIGSIMQIRVASEEGDLPMRVDFSGDKIVIVLSKEDFNNYNLLKGHSGLSSALTCAIVLPVLVEALHYLESEEGKSEDDSVRWVRSLNHRIESLGLQAEKDDFLLLAQKLLELPLRRSLTSSRQLIDVAL